MPETRALCLNDVIAEMDTEGLAYVDAGDWNEEWRERWVVFADLVAFGERALRSRDVVLNNIVRFDRASGWASSACPSARVFRFSDSTFAICDTAGAAVAFGSAIQHACLALNALTARRHRLFIHMITPRVTIARGDVLMLPETLPPKARFLGLRKESLIAGSGIVGAYQIEKGSAAGLVTMKLEHAVDLASLVIRGDNDPIRVALAAFFASLANSQAPGSLFVRNDSPVLVDLPWLLMRPKQETPLEVWCADKAGAHHAISAHIDVWESGLREFYVSNGAGKPLDVSKHSAAALRHTAQCLEASSGRDTPHYLSIEDMRKLLQQ